MSRLTDDRLANTIKEGTFIEMDVRDLKKIKQPSMEELYEKLNRYERIEDEIGCPLEVVFKVLQDDIIWYETESGITYSCGMSLIQFGSLDFHDENGNMFNLKDYKKTWWLKEDKSE